MKNTTRLLCLIVLMVLTGCAHGGISSWEGNRFVACCNRVFGGCNEENWQKIALQACPSGDVTVLGGFTASQVTGLSYGGGQAHYNRSHQSCRKYTCNTTFVFND